MEEGGSNALDALGRIDQDQLHGNGEECFQLGRFEGMEGRSMSKEECEIPPPPGLPGGEAFRAPLPPVEDDPQSLYLTTPTTMATAEDALKMPAEGSETPEGTLVVSGFTCDAVVFGFIGIFLHLGALPLLFTQGELPTLAAHALIATLISGAFLSGVLSVRNRIGVCYVTFLLGMCCTVISIVFFWQGGVTGMQLFIMPELNNCSVGDVKSSMAGTSPPSLFRCYDGFLDSDKEVNISVDGINSRMLRIAPVYLEPESSSAAPALLAVATGDDILERAPCGALNHSHGHAHPSGDGMQLIHSHDHVHTRICGFTLNVRQTDSTLQLPSELLDELRKAHINAGGENFEVSSIPVVDLIDPTELSQQLKMYCIFGLLCYGLSLLGLCACFFRSFIMTATGRDCFAGRRTEVKVFAAPEGNEGNA
eukprot:TRINITY_DN42129_c0_g1_i1.p1 TRINITY_DN42129_c0_g1~~TRINITY_DN42129_c0_g1_i1.p1  ORF type:complete len:423 (-),score=67.65 TRINITY_DN42129_c0_g1_i1:55-1323(-)